MSVKSILLFVFSLIYTLAFSQGNDEKVKDIGEVVIKAKVKRYKKKKDNPAYSILQEVWKRKRENALEKYKTYSYDEYEKIEFDINNIDSSLVKKKIFNKMDFIFDYADSTSNGKLKLPFFLNEAVYKIYGENQPQKRTKRKLTAQKTAGFQDNEVVALMAKNLFKDTNIFSNTINFFNIGFESPISSTGFSVYDYNLLEDVTIDGNECYRILYEPKRKDVLAFRGYIYIVKDGYNLAKVTLRSPKSLTMNFVKNLYAEFEFSSPDADSYLPYRIYSEFEFSFSKTNKEAKGLITKRSIRYTDYQFNKDFDPKIFTEKDEPTATKDLARDDEYWKTARTDSLSKSEAGIYTMLDRLNEVPKFKAILKAYRTLGTGYYNINEKIDVGSIYSIFGQNNIEGLRLRLGARTFFSQNDTWRVEGYGAYGFKDRKFKYGAEARIMLNKNNRLSIGIGTRRDILQLGSRLTTGEGIMSSSFASSLVSRSGNGLLSNVTQTNVFTSIEPVKNLQFRLDGTLQSITSANPEQFSMMYLKDGQLRKTVNDAKLTLSIIAKPGAKYSKIGLDRKEHSTLSPTLMLKYTRGIEGLFNADFNYDKLQFMYYQPMIISTWGKSYLTVEAGTNFNAVPLALQNIIPANESYVISRNTFSQLNYYEFVADSYATLHYEHHFNGKFLSYIPLIKKLKLREVGFFRAATGSLSEASKNINIGAKKYSAPTEHIYYEYGFGIENIGLGNFRFFRIDFNWRGNYLDRPGISKFGIKAGLQLSL